MMGVEYQIQDGVLMMTFAGTYQPEDVTERFLAALHDSACPSPVALLIDVTRSEVLAERPAAEIRRVAEFLGPYSERIGGRCAVVAPADVLFGLSQMGSVHTERVGVTSRVFRGRDEALAWLKGMSASRT
jgi:hypothetical protein